MEGFPDKATVTDAIILQQIQNADIDLSLLAKNVRFVSRSRASSR